MEQNSDILIASLPIDLSDTHAFDRATARLDAALNRMPAQRRACIYDGDDLTFFDHDGLRVGLSLVSLPDQGFLVLALGAHPDIGSHFDSEEVNELFARTLLKMIAPTAEAETILWQRLHGVLDPDIVDAVAVHLEECDLPVIKTARQMADPMLKDVIEVPNAQVPCRSKIMSHRIAPQQKDDVLADLRAAIAIPDAPEHNMPMKLSAYALSGACVFVTPAMGVAMLTYSVLRHVQEVAAT